MVVGSRYKRHVAVCSTKSVSCAGFSTRNSASIIINRRSDINSIVAFQLRSVGETQEIRAAIAALSIEL